MLKEGGQWDGTCVCRRKTGDPLPLYTRLFRLPKAPAASAAGASAAAAAPSAQRSDTKDNPTARCRLSEEDEEEEEEAEAEAEEVEGAWPGAWLLLVQEAPAPFLDKSLSADLAQAGVFYAMPARGSLHSTRKASYDVRSLGSDSKNQTDSFAYLT